MSYKTPAFNYTHLVVYEFNCTPSVHFHTSLGAAIDLATESVANHRCRRATVFMLNGTCIAEECFTVEWDGKP